MQNEPPKQINAETLSMIIICDICCLCDFSFHNINMPLNNGVKVCNNCIEFVSNGG